MHDRKRSVREIFG